MGRANNTHKFVSFTKKIAKVGGDAARWSSKLAKISGENTESYLLEAITKWNDMDHSQKYSDFRDDLPLNDLKTCAQVLHYKEVVVDTIVKHLSDKSNPALLAIVEISMGAIRDYRDCLNEHLLFLLKPLTELADFEVQEKGKRRDDDIQLVETVFLALTLICKLFPAELLRHFKRVFSLLLPLLSNKRQFIRRLASEAFAFVLRKAEKLEKISRVITAAVVDDDEKITDGASLLFFYICRGTNKHLHSQASEKFGHILRGLLSDDSRERGLVVLVKTLQNIISYASPSESSRIVKVVLEVIEKEGGSSLEVARAGWTLISSAIEHSRSFKKNPSLIDEAVYSSFCASLGSHSIHVALFLHHLEPLISSLWYSEEWLGRLRALLSSIFTDCSVRDGVNLLRELMDHPFFHLHFLPLLSLLSAKEEKDNREILSLLASVCEKQRPLTEVDSQSEREPFFDATSLSSLKMEVARRVCHLEDEEPADIAFLVVSWPWLFTTHENVIGANEVARFLSTSLSGNLLDTDLLLVIASSLFAVHRKFLLQTSKDTLFEFMRRRRVCPASARLLRLWLLARDEWEDQAELDELASLVGQSLLSPHSSTRIALLDSLSRFRLLLPVDDKGNQEPENAFSELLSAEREPHTLDRYRSRLMFLRKLSCPHHRRFLPSSLAKKHEHIVLRVLLSQYFEKMTLLWPQIHPIAETFARLLPIDEFWQVLNSALLTASSAISEGEKEARVTPWAQLTVGGSERRVDYVTFRIQLFKLLETIPEIAERRTKLLSPILISIYQRDYLNEERNREDELLDAEEEDHEEQKKEEGGSRKVKERRLGKRATHASLTAILEVFAKFNDPKSVYQEKYIKLMYDELLLCAELQSVVLRCMFTYKVKAILPYREHLERLLDEKKMKDELVLFSVDEQGSMVEEEHRAYVIPLFLRIVLGMLRKKARLAHRPALLNAVAGCRPDELSVFISILFQPILPILGDAEADPRLEAVKKEVEGNGHSSTLSLPRIAWAVRSAGSLVTRLAPSLLASDQAVLFRLLCVSALLVHSARSHFPLKALRPLRQAIAEAFQKFFHAFPNRKLSESEWFLMQEYIISADAQAVPALPSAVEEDIEGKERVLIPLSVLRLFVVWTELPQLYSLLNARLSVLGNSFTPLNLLCESLSLSLNLKNVVDTCRGAFSNLLTYADEPQTNEHLHQAELKILPDVNMGTSLLVQQLPFVLSFLLKGLEGDSSIASPSPSADIDMLARLSPFISSSSHRSHFAAVLLRQLVNSPRHPRLSSILTALSGFAPSLQDPLEAVRSLAPLFSAVESRECREGLCSVLRGLSLNPLLSELREDLEVAAELDAWDARRVDEPHFDRRHAAYNKLEKMYNSCEKKGSEIMAVLGHSHSHTLSSINDVTLRASASAALQGLIRFLGKIEMESEERSKIIDSHFVPICTTGFTHKDQLIRDEFIRCFSELVSVGVSVGHPTLSPLSQLHSDKEDGDLDFFLNVVHIQLHRRQRAIFRLADDLEKGRMSIGTESLLKYIVPLLQPWLLFIPSSGISSSSLSDESLHLLSVILSRAPWKKYLAMLEYWIRRLNSSTENQKGVVRVVVAVLDAFHFDCSESGTPSIRAKVTNYLLPTLKACVDGKEKRTVHKKAGNKKYYSEDDDLQRTPVALALAKLLLKLPQKMMDEHLYGLILKLCSLLSSRSVSVRQVSRKTLTQISEALGPKYLPFVIKQLKLNLDKGFQIHVMIFTVHTLLCTMQPRLQHGDLDSCVDELMQACCDDLFGRISEEKEVGAIRDATIEAKHSKSADTLAILARFVSSSCVARLIKPLEEAMHQNPSAKTKRTVSSVLAEISVGLRKNTGMDHRQLLIYIHHVMNENLTRLRAKELMEEREEEMMEEEAARKKTESCLILEKTPRRVGEVECSAKGHAPVLLEFALQLLAALLGGDSWKDKGDSARLDPFLLLIKDALQTKYEKVVCLGLRCVLLLLPLPLPSLPSFLPFLAERLFVLLSGYAAFSTNRHGILQLNQLIFKTAAALIRYAKEDVIGEKRIDILFSYLLSDVFDYQKQATAFAVLRSILVKEIRHEHLKTIMSRVEEMSIQSEISHVRASCRQLLLLYIGAHPDGRDVSTEMSWILAQLEYETEDGRLSAIETLHALFASLVPSALDEVSLECVVRLGSRLVNEESEKARGMAALATRRLLFSLSDSRRNDATLAVKDWLSSPKDGIRAAAASVLQQMCLVEEMAESDRQRLSTLLPLAINSLRMKETDCEWKEVSGRTARLLLDALSSLVSVLPDVAHSDHLAALYEVTMEWVKSPLEETRLPSARLLGHALSFGNQSMTPDPWLLFESSSWHLAGKRLADSELAKQGMRNILVVVEWLEEKHLEKACTRLHNIARYEIVHSPNESIKRSSCFKLCAAMALKMSGDRLLSILRVFIPLLVREISRKSNKTNVEELASLATEVLEVLKKGAGEGAVTAAMSEAARSARLQRDERITLRKRVSAIDPEQAARERIERQKKKREARKRKLDVLNPLRKFKKAQADESFE